MDVPAKARLKKDVPLLLLNCPEDVKPLFSDYKIIAGNAGKTPVKQVILFVTTQAALASEFIALLPLLEDDALVWIAYAKKGSKYGGDLFRNESWAVMKQYGYEAVTAIAIDADWSGLRYRKIDENRKSTFNVAPEERNIEGIDFVNRKVSLPADAEELFCRHKGVTDFFNSMSFTHKKEYIEAIVTAKKPETRKARIEKTIVALKEKMQQKKKV